MEGRILREPTEILRKDIRDPRLDDITIIAVECTNNLPYVTVYCSLLTEDPAKEKEVAEGFDKAKEMMCHLLSQALTVYKVPELILRRNTSVACGSRIDSLINQVRKQDQGREDENK